MPGHPRLSRSQDVDGRDICAKTRFALLPGHDVVEAFVVEAFVVEALV
jgi:hypothetical protein